MRLALTKMVQKIAVGGVSDEVWIYDMEDGEQLVTLKGNSIAVFALAFSPQWSADRNRRI